jgi:hypothetical protein
MAFKTQLVFVLSCLQPYIARGCTLSIVERLYACSAPDLFLQDGCRTFTVAGVVRVMTVQALHMSVLSAEENASVFQSAYDMYTSGQFHWVAVIGCRAILVRGKSGFHVHAGESIPTVTGKTGLFLRPCGLQMRCRIGMAAVTTCTAIRKSAKLSMRTA